MNRGQVLGAVLVFGLVLGGCVDETTERKSALVAGCLRDGNTSAACECMANMAGESLEPAVLEAMALGADGRIAEMEAAYSTLTAAQKSSVSTFVQSAKQACNLSEY
ncbi:MAG: hypothetical protein R3C52_14920 [Hyphomonadaceae bacterium]